jgi:hypothetical protein
LDETQVMKTCRTGDLAGTMSSGRKIDEEVKEGEDDDLER